MKRKGWLITVLIVVCISWVYAVNKYGIKSGIITMESVSTIGKMKIKMTKIIYFDDYGMKECQETYTDGKISHVFFCDGKEKISLTPLKKKALKQGAADNGIGMRVDINDMGTKKDIDSGMVKKMPPMTIAGQSCEIIQVARKDGAKDIYGGWNNVLVYLKTSASGVATEMKAVKIVANAAVPKDKFQVPAGYTVQ